MRYTHAELTARFMMNWHRAKRPGSPPLWSRVMAAFACGSTAAREICIGHGMDPEMPTKQRRM